MAERAVRGRSVTSAARVAGTRRLPRVFRTGDPKGLRLDLEQLVDGLLALASEWAAPSLTHVGPVHEDVDLEIGVATRIDASDADVTATLPTASDELSGRALGVILVGGSVTIRPRGDSLVQGDPSTLLTDPGFYFFFCDGTDWWGSQATGLLPQPAEDGDILYYEDGAWQRLPVGDAEEVLTVDAGLPAWRPATGVAPMQPHDITHSPIALWNFEDTWDDTSGNGNHLTRDSGSIAGTGHTLRVGPELWALELSAGGMLGVLSSSLRILGDITIEFLLNLDSRSNSCHIISCEGTGAGSGANMLYGVYWDAGGATGRTLGWQQESGSNVQSNALLRIPPVQGCFATNEWLHVAYTRDSDIIRVYIDGQLYGTDPNTLTSPDDGSSAKFRIWGSSTLTVPATGMMASLKVIASALSADQVKAEYNRTLGPAKGRIP